MGLLAFAFRACRNSPEYFETNIPDQQSKPENLEILQNPIYLFNFCKLDAVKISNFKGKLVPKTLLNVFFDLKKL